MKMFQEKTKTMPMQKFGGKRGVLWDLCEGRIFSIKWARQLANMRLRGKLDPCLKRTNSIEKHLNKKDFVRVSQFFELPKVKILPTVYFCDDLVSIICLKLKELTCAYRESSLSRKCSWNRTKKTRRDSIIIRRERGWKPVVKSHSW